MEPTENLRKSSRRRTLFGGVLFDADDKKWECSVSDISASGAKVKTEANLAVGSFTELKITKFNDLRRAEVMWVRDGVIGIRFVVNISKDQPGVAEFFKIIAD